MVLAAVLVTLIGRGSEDIKLIAKGLSNLRRLSTCNPVSLSLYRPGPWTIFVHRLGVNWYLSFSRDVSHYIEFACMDISRQYRGMSVR